MTKLLLLILLSIGLTNISFAEIKIPTFGHASSAEGGWTCNENYYRSMNKKTCFKVPKNAYSGNNSNSWECYSGYKKITMASNGVGGNTCKKIASLTLLDNSLEKSQGKYRNFPNTDLCFLFFNGSGQTVAGEVEDEIKFRKLDKLIFSMISNECNIFTDQMPENAHRDSNIQTSEGWTCDTNYYRDRSKRFCIRVPDNAYSARYMNDFQCNFGFQKIGGNQCKKIDDLFIPNNAHSVNLDTFVDTRLTLISLSSYWADECGVPELELSFYKKRIIKSKWFCPLKNETTLSTHSYEVNFEASPIQTLGYPSIIESGVFENVEFKNKWSFLNYSNNILSLLYCIDVDGNLLLEDKCSVEQKQLRYKIKSFKDINSNTDVVLNLPSSSLIAWACNKGFKKSGDKCVNKINKLATPSYRN